MLIWGELNIDSVAQLVQRNQTETTDQTDTGFFAVSNDEFLGTIFGDNFGSAKPLVCCKSGDPASGGWKPSFWPCVTSDSSQNWYFCPGLYEPDANGQARAKRELAQAVHVLCLDDLGIKVNLQVLEALAPTWLIETSPGNYQAGYLFDQPVVDLECVDELKQKLIENGLCDPGASGGSARWMRLPVWHSPKSVDK